MRTVAYYHLHVTDNPLIWSSLLIEQLKYFEDYGLMEKLDKIVLCCISQNDNRDKILINLLSTYNTDKFDVRFIKNPYKNDVEFMEHHLSEDAFSEGVTLYKMWEDSQKENMNILYFHAKGTTSYLLNQIETNASRHKTYYYWRNLLNWGVLEKWESCLSALNEGYDVAGIDYLTSPFPHYCGNFWWSKSEHIRKLPSPLDKSWYRQLLLNAPQLSSSPSRMSDEMWVCSIPTKAYDVASIPLDKRPQVFLNRKDYNNYYKG